MFVHLLSNASVDVFPNNKLGDFTTVLAQPLKLFDDVWEVGLAEIHVPFAIDMITSLDAWYEINTLTTKEVIGTANSLEELQDKFKCVIRKNDDCFEASLPNNIMIALPSEQAGLPKQIYGDMDRVFVGTSTEETTIRGPFTCTRIESTDSKKHSFAERYFEKIDDLLRVIESDTFKLSMDSNNRVHCIISKLDKQIIVRFSDLLSNILGFRNQSLQQQKTTAEHLPDSYPGINCLLVYSNIVEDSFVGDTCAPLLRVLPLKHVNRNQIMSYECHPVQYKKVLRREIDAIQIRIVDDVGRRLAFTGQGRVALTLHFRPHGPIHSH